MKKLLFAVFLLIAQPVFSQTPLFFAWDYDDALIGEINDFQVRYDGGPWTSVGVPAPFTTSDTCVGCHSYKVPLPTLTPGANHTASVVACSATMGCSFEVSLPFKLVGPAKNPRITK